MRYAIILLLLNLHVLQAKEITVDHKISLLIDVIEAQTECIVELEEIVESLEMRICQLESKTSQEKKELIIDKVNLFFEG